MAGIDSEVYSKDIVHLFKFGTIASLSLIHMFTNNNYTFLDEGTNIIPGKIIFTHAVNLGRKIC